MDNPWRTSDVFRLSEVQSLHDWATRHMPGQRWRWRHHMDFAERVGWACSRSCLGGPMRSGRSCSLIFSLTQRTGATLTFPRARDASWSNLSVCVNDHTVRGWTKERSFLQESIHFLCSAV